MNQMSKFAMWSLFLMCGSIAFAQESMDNSATCSTKESQKPSAMPCAPTPCPPKPCKPCPPVCFERGYPDNNCCLAAAYNEPASFAPGPCSWDFWADASFTYWTAYEEGLSLGISNVDLSALPSSTYLDRVSLLQSTKWEPGFKVGLGIDLGHDNWGAFAEYTWFRSRATCSATAPDGPAGSTTPSWVINNFGLENTIVAATASALSSTWRLRMDVLDVGLTRPYYQGTHLIISPFSAVRAEWIRQNLRIKPTAFATASANTNAVFHNCSQSWALGPRGGLQGKWHLGAGFRVEGDMGASLLFTRYTKVKSFADPLTFGVRPYSLSYTDYNTLRFDTDMSIGIGWGSYLDCRKYHFDLLASYDFQIFWNQNMMRELVDGFQGYTSPAIHNLYLQGLTVKAQFDF